MATPGAAVGPGAAHALLLLDGDGALQRLVDLREYKVIHSGAKSRGCEVLVSQAEERRSTGAGVVGGEEVEDGVEER